MTEVLAEIKTYLYHLIPFNRSARFPGKLGLERMNNLLQRLGNPHKNFMSIHVVGTSGKGSTSYLISKILQELGFIVGLHTSPHLQTMRERMQINGRLIDKNEFINIIKQIKPVISAMEGWDLGKPSLFEVLLAATFLYFAQKHVDVAVVEAGCGGRYDGSNVLKAEIAVVTNIGLDHTKILGKTKVAILKDKIQIIKADCFAAIAGIANKKLFEILNDHCKQRNVPLFALNKDFKFKKKSCDQRGSCFDFFFKNSRFKNIRLSLPGIYQLDNASLAIAACLRFAEKRKITLPGTQVKKALRNAFFPARMEVVQKKPLIILDGAHNEDKIKALVTSIKKLYANKNFLVIFGVKKDKNVKKMLLQLSNICNEFIISQFGQATDMGFKLNYKAGELYYIAKETLPKAKLLLTQNCDVAIKKAIKIAKQQKKAILLTGSLYLAGEARQFFKLNPNKPANSNMLTSKT